MIRLLIAKYDSCSLFQLIRNSINRPNKRQPEAYLLVWAVSSTNATTNHKSRPNHHVRHSNHPALEHPLIKVRPLPLHQHGAYPMRIHQGAPMITPYHKGCILKRSLTRPTERFRMTLYRDSVPNKSITDLRNAQWRSTRKWSDDVRWKAGHQISPKRGSRSKWFHQKF